MTGLAAIDLVAAVLAVEGLADEGLAAEELVLDFAPLRASLRDDLLVEDILGYSLYHPALETGQATIHPPVNGSEIPARTKRVRGSPQPIRRPGGVPQKARDSCRAQTSMRNAKTGYAPQAARSTAIALIDCYG